MPAIVLLIISYLAYIVATLHSYVYAIGSRISIIALDYTFNYTNALPSIEELLIR
jgi:hypothetical protein